MIKPIPAYVFMVADVSLEFAFTARLLPGIFKPTYTGYLSPDKGHRIFFECLIPLGTMVYCFENEKHFMDKPNSLMIVGHN